MNKVKEHKPESAAVNKTYLHATAKDTDLFCSDPFPSHLTEDHGLEHCADSV